jgi:hypothetical protein
VAPSVYAGLPAEFSSPNDAALRVARLGTAAERLALLNHVPPGYRWWVVHEAKLDIALAIVELPDKAARQEALAEVPEAWGDDVRAHVLRLWRTYDIRAEYQAELAAAREAKLEREAA